MLLDTDLARNDASAKSAKVKGGGQKVMDAKHRDRLDGLRVWYENYCGSCRGERDRVFGLGKGRDSSSVL